MWWFYPQGKYPLVCFVAPVRYNGVLYLFYICFNVEGFYNWNPGDICVYSPGDYRTVRQRNRVNMLTFCFSGDTVRAEIVGETSVRGMAPRCYSQEIRIWTFRAPYDTWLWYWNIEILLGYLLWCDVCCIRDLIGVARMLFDYVEAALSPKGFENGQREIWSIGGMS